MKLHDKIREIEADAIEAWNRRAPTQEPDVCSVCVGDGVPLSGAPCICGGRGTARAEADGLRDELRRLRAPHPGGGT